MKKFLERKDREKRVVALWLVFVMMLTPVLTNLGGKKGTKAQDTSAITVSFNAQNDTATVGGSLGINTKLPATAEWTEWANDTSKYVNAGITPERYSIYMKSGDTIKYLIPNAVLTATWGNKSYGYKVYESEEEILDKAPSDQITEFSASSGDYAVEDIVYSGTKYLVLYARETEAETEAGTEAATEAGTEVAAEAGTEVAAEAGTEAAAEAGTEAAAEAGTEAAAEAGTEAGTEEGTDAGTTTHTKANTLYSATDIIKLVSIDTLIAKSIKITKEEDADSASYEIQKYNNGPIYIHLPGIEEKYKVLELDSSNNNIFVDYSVMYVDTVNGTPKKESIYDGKPMMIPALTGDVADETHSIEIGLYSEAGFYCKKTVEDITIIAADLTEKIAPEITSVTLCQGSSSSYSDIADYDNSVSGAYYTTEAADTLYYKITATDTGSGIDKVKYAEKEITPVEGVYYISVSKYNPDNNQVIVYDKAGNVSLPAALRQVKVLDATQKYVSVKIDAGDAVGEVDTIDVRNPFEMAQDTYTYTKSPDAIYADVTIKSGLQINKVELKANNELIATETGLTGVVNDAEKCYIYSIPGLILNNAGVCKEFDNIQVVVTYSDNNTQTIELGNLFCDPKAPQDTQNPTVEFQCNNSIAGNYYVDTSKATSDYRFVITNVADNQEGSGIETVNLYRGNGNENNVIATLNVNGNGEYIYNLTGTGTDNNDFEYINTNPNGVTYTVEIMDKAGNKATYNLPTLKKLDTDIRFGEVSIKNVDGDTKYFWENPSSFNLALGAGHKLYVSVESAYSINGAYLRKKIEELTPTDTEFTLEEKTEVELDAGRKKTTLVFSIPAKLATGNEAYDNITLYVTDEVNNSKNISLGQLIYDNSHPYVEKLKYERTWVKEADASLTYEVVAGSESVESVLSEASYTLEGETTAITLNADRTTGEQTIKMPETKDPAIGTTITFAAKDNAGNALTTLDGTKPNQATMLVDGHSPIVSALTVDNISEFVAPLGGVPTVKTTFTDNLALGKVDVTVTYPNGVSKVYTKSYDSNNGLGVDVSDSFEFQVEASDGKAADGAYGVSVVAYDKAGNKSVTNSLNFTVDNTVPVVNLAIADGTKGGKQPRQDGTDYYYRSNVSVSLEVDEENFVGTNIRVTDKVGNGNEKPVNVTWSKIDDKYVGSMTASAEGHHVVSISANDATGNQAVSKSVNFCIDKSAPGISLTLNGLAYQESRGVVDLTTDADISASVSDMTEDKNDFNVQIIQTKPDNNATNPAYVKTTSRSFGFSEEADYTVNFFAADMANNKSDTRTVEFRIDKTAPDLTISGAAGGGTSANAATVTFTMKEAFWWDAGGQVTIYRKAGDGKEEALLKTVDVKPTAFETSVSEVLSDTGVYRFEFTGYDRVGHRVETTQSFTIDREAPVVTLAGVANYDMTTENVLFSAQIVDDFYTSKSVSVTGTITDINGKVQQIKFNPYTTVANPTVITQEFKEDGIYDIEVSSKDMAGNNHSSKVHFVIDKNEPEIGDLSAFDGTILKSFVWETDLNDLVSDLTVCDTHMYLNGSEYDGVSDIEDGSYTLLITAEDELGHMVEKSVSFVLDTKAPVFIVTGVEDGEAKLDPYTISVSLQLDEDTLTEVALNGTAIDIVDNAANLTVSENGEFTLTMKAIDAAGNEASDSISFIVGEEKKTSNWWMWLIIACGVVLIGIVTVIVVKKNNKED